jgi:hypothetical protein
VLEWCVLYFTLLYFIYIYFPSVQLQENLVVILAGRYVAQGGGINWTDVSKKLASHGFCKTEEQCSDFFFSVLRPRLLEPSPEERWADDSLLFAKGSKAVVGARSWLVARGVLGCSEQYSLQHVDWGALGRVVKMSALQVPVLVPADRGRQAGSHLPT